MLLEFVLQAWCWRYYSNSSEDHEYDFDRRGLASCQDDYFGCSMSSDLSLEVLKVTYAKITLMYDWL